MVPGVLPLRSIPRDFVNKPPGCQELDTVRSDRGLLQFVRPGVHHFLCVYHKLAGVAVIDEGDGRLRQWQLCTDGGGGLEPAREQRGEIVIAVALNVTGELA